MVFDAYCSGSGSAFDGGKGFVAESDCSKTKVQGKVPWFRSAGKEHQCGSQVPMRGYRCAFQRNIKCIPNKTERVFLPQDNSYDESKLGVTSRTQGFSPSR